MSRLRLPHALPVVAFLAAGCGENDGSEIRAGDNRADAGDGDALPPADAEGSSADSGPGELALTTWTDGELTPAPWLAAQDGDGEWQVLESMDGSYSFTVVSGRYAVVMKCNPRRSQGGGIALVWALSTVDEQPSLALTCAGSDPTGTIDVTVPGLAEGDEAEPHAVESTDRLHPDGPTWTIAEIPPGTRDVVTLIDGGSAMDEQIVITRGVEVSSGATTDVAVDLGDAVPTEQHVFQEVVGANWSGVALVTADGTTVELGDYFSGLDESYMHADDMHRAAALRSEDFYHNRGVVVWIHDARDIEAELPDIYDGSSIEPIDGRPAVTFSLDPISDAPTSGYQAEFGQDDEGRSFKIDASAGWLETSANATVVLPDFAAMGLAGWDPAWVLQPEGDTGAYVTAIVSDHSTVDFGRRYEWDTVRPNGAWDGHVEAYSQQLVWYRAADE